MTKKQSSPKQLPERGQLRVPKEVARAKITQQLERVQILRDMAVGNTEQLQELKDKAQTWREVTRQLLRSLCTNDDLYSKFTSYVAYGYPDHPAEQLAFEKDRLGADARKTQSILEQLDLIDEAPNMAAQPPREQGVLEKLELIAKRFHAVARQLRRRQHGRTPFEVGDEYDVQDLLHALLIIFFNDVRREDPAPSHAGGSTRIDFVLKVEDTVVEAKMTRAGLKDKELGAQLIQDSAHYISHPNCRRVVFLVYDPDGHIVNAPGIMRDVRASAPAGLDVHVLIFPE